MLAFLSTAGTIETDLLVRCTWKLIILGPCNFWSDPETSEFIVVSLEIPSLCVRLSMESKVPSTRIRIFSNLQLFLSRYGLPSTRIRRIRQRIRKKINPLFRVEKTKSATNPITRGQVNLDTFESDDEESASSLSLTNKSIMMAVNLKARVVRTEQISRHYLTLQCILWRHFSAEEPWVLELIRIPSDTCGRANSIWIRYVWTGRFLNPVRKSCGFKNIRIRVDGA